MYVRFPIRDRRVNVVLTLLVISQAVGCSSHKGSKTTAKQIMARSKSVAKDNALQSTPKAKSEAPKSSGPKTASVSSSISYVPTVRLLPLETIQNQLQLTTEQKARIAEIENKYREAHDNWANAGEGTFHRQMTERLSEARRKLSAELVEVLNENQRNQLARIAIQVNGTPALLDAFVAGRLKITDEQQAKINEIRTKTNGELSKLAKAAKKGPSVMDMSAKSKDLGEKIDSEIAAFLTAEQKQELATLKQPIRISSLTSKDMVNKLQITADQKAQLTAIVKAQSEQEASVTATSNGKKNASKESKAKLKELSADADKKMLAILTPQQKQAFDSVPRDPRRPRALLQTKIADKIKLTDQQKAKLADIEKTDAKDMNVLSKAIRKSDTAKKDRSKKMRELRLESDEQMLAILTVDQRLSFASMKGNSPKISFRDLQASNTPSN